MRKIVVPGDLLTDQRRKLGLNVYLKEGKVYSSTLGLLTESNDYISVIPLNGIYVPHQNDGVVGIIKSETSNGYIIDINSYDSCFFPKSLLSKQLGVGTLLFARVKSGGDNVDIDNINILPKGYLINVPSVKVPRLIGKNESMLKLLKEYTKSNIVIGKNGRVWYTSQNSELLERAINLIIKNSQKSNLTNSVKEFLIKNTQ